MPYSDAVIGKANVSKLVIVESPAKAHKIASYLGSGYVVKSSVGHIRDLPTSAAQVPAKYKSLPWARTGVDVDDGFTPLYVVSPDKRSVIKELKDALAQADELFLATDEDREGEAIAWHLLQELKPKVPVKRMVFHEITAGAIRDAVAHPRNLDDDLVDAQETRRILDRLYGYEVSPVLWKKVLPKLSAGRVQSVATRLVVDRERERIAFVAATYCDIDVELSPRQGEGPGTRQGEGPGTRQGEGFRTLTTGLASPQTFGDSTVAFQRIGSLTESPPPAASAVGSLTQDSVPAASQSGSLTESPPPAASQSGSLTDSPPPAASDSVRAFTARLTTLGPSRIAQGRDFDANGTLKAKDVLILTEADADALARALPQAAFTVAKVDSKPSVRRPAAPFRTTTLQQEAGRKLGFTTARTMSVAQELYESGHITYMRTDSVTLSQQAIEAARRQITALYGVEYLPSRPRLYDSKVKNAQEAHEAIRPAGDECVPPAKTGLRGDQLRLYELVWQRTLASQMVDAQALTVTVGVDATLASKVTLGLGPVSRAGLTASGTTYTFPGFRRAYVESFDEDEEAAAVLPPLDDGQALAPLSVTPQTHATKPPARYTEPSLVAKMEELEIGRPSTYASIIRTITSRDYVFKRGSALVPTWLAFAVTRLLEEHFTDLVDYTFTASLEDKLDAIADGKAKRLAVLTQFYFGDKDAAHGLRALVDNLGDIDARALSTFPLGDSGIDVRVGRYGTYVEDADGKRANVPDDFAPDELTPAKAKELLLTTATAAGTAGRELGTDPETGRAVVARDGRYGPYITLATDDAPPRKGAAKTPTASLFKSMSLDTITLDDALRLLSLPRTLGVADDGEVIVATNGRYGPFLKKGTADFRSLETEEQLFTVSLDEAKALFAQPKPRRGGRGGGAGTARPAGRALGDDPNTGQPVTVRDGRYGPYVTDGTTNATLRKTDDPATITIDRAAELLAEKRAKAREGMAGAGPAPKRVVRRGARRARG